MIFFKKCHVAILKNFNVKILKWTLGQVWLADKIGVAFQKASTYLKLRDLFFFWGFESIFAKCEPYYQVVGLQHLRCKPTTLATFKLHISHQCLLGLHRWGYTGLTCWSIQYVFLANEIQTKATLQITLAKEWMCSLITVLELENIDILYKVILLDLWGNYVLKTY